ncbi:hypothetical protein V8E36_008467 [Tilletia maclaganii]
MSSADPVQTTGATSSAAITTVTRTDAGSATSHADQAQASGSAATTSPQKPGTSEGEQVSDVELKDGSAPPPAIKRKSRDGEANTDVSSDADPITSSASTETQEPQPPPPASTSSPASSTTAGSASSSQNPAPGHAPPRKKKKSILGARVAAASGGPPKLNTLEKSKNDWAAFKASASASNDAAKLTVEEREAMEAQTRVGVSAKGGTMDGFLDRSDFLDRVRERVEAAEDEQRRSTLGRR